MRFYDSLNTIAMLCIVVGLAFLALDRTNGAVACAFLGMACSGCVIIHNQLKDLP